jgi:hypothetical protein
MWGGGEAPLTSQTNADMYRGRDLTGPRHTPRTSAKRTASMPPMSSAFCWTGGDF